MVRPKNCRLVGAEPGHNLFKPAGIPASRLESVVLSIDEFEAVRLADYEGLYHEGAAKSMGVSRQTFGRIIESSREKIADVLVNGKVLKIEGGEIKMTGIRKFKCYSCDFTWEKEFGTGRPESCPECGSDKLHRIDDLAGTEPRGKRRSGGTLQRGKRCGIKIEEKITDSKGN